MKRYLVFLAVIFVACSSRPVVPTSEAVKVSRDEAKTSCKELGPVKGTVQGVKPNLEKAVEDMKMEAANKGANYVRMETASGYGTAVQGTAYLCP